SDFTHQHSRRIVRRFEVIAVEDVSVKRLVQNQCLAKRLHDAAWSQFSARLSYQAAGAGRKVVAVNPAKTSHDCSGCGHRQRRSLAERTYHGPCCGLVRDRDLNASKHILALGRQCLASAEKPPDLSGGVVTCSLSQEHSSRRQSRRDIKVLLRVWFGVVLGSGEGGAAARLPGVGRRCRGPRPRAPAAGWW